MEPQRHEEERIRSAHPVEPAMRAQIMEELAAIEARHEVTVLFACESGSRGWGFASPDSDYDVRFIYVNRLPWYLTVTPRRDVIELPISGELDINGWDLRKALGLMRESNPTLLEWLRSPIVYREDAQAMPRFRALSEAVFSNARGWHHYASMAKKNFREHLQAETVRYKKYLYVLRPLLAARWIRMRPGVPPMRFADLAQHARSGARRRADRRDQRAARGEDARGRGRDQPALAGHPCLHRGGAGRACGRARDGAAAGRCVGARCLPQRDGAALRG